MAENSTNEVSELKECLARLERERAEVEERHARDRMEWDNRMRELEGLVRSSAVLDAQPTTTHSQATGSTIQVPISNEEVSRQINVQVEHVLKGDRDAGSYRIRPFSGKGPKHGEVTFDEWARQIEMVLEDDAISERGKRQKILNSLNSPAVDIARGMGDIAAHRLYQRLERMYGSTCNGVRLLQEFFRLHMEPTESATDYIQRLSVKLSAVVRKNGISEEQVDETILTHFKSTCNDEKISNILHIKYDTSHPPTLQELMREVKMADEELNARFSKRRDPPTQRPRITHHMQGARTEAKDPDGISVLREEMRAWKGEVHSVLQAMQSLPRDKTNQHERGNAGTTRGGSTQPDCMKRFCYNCGLCEGHYQQHCPNPANPTRVHKLLNERSKILFERNASRSINPLNRRGPHH